MRALELDLPYLEKLRGLIDSIAASYNLDPAVIAAVISRESGGGRLLGKHGNPDMTGDRGHGRGLMQADDRYWKGLLNLDAKGGEEDAWKYPAFNIAFGCWLLRTNLNYYNKKFPMADEQLNLRAALAAYNCGIGNVNKSIREGRDVDARTHNHDYSQDVVKRAEWLRERAWGMGPLRG